MTIEKLISNGYEYIGMDHFAKSDDELTAAQQQGSLHRIFQGYTTQCKTDLFAFGISSISQFGDTYFQNYKGFQNYFNSIQKGQLPIEKGFIMSKEDIQINIIINKLMCDMKLNYKHISNIIKEDFQIKYSKEINTLRELYSDNGIVHFYEEGLEVSDIGKLFIRNVAMAFDKYLIKSNSIYSKTV